jgi:hypothetical protein
MAMAAVLLAGTLPFNLIALRTDGVYHGETSRTNAKHPNLPIVGHAKARHKRDRDGDSLSNTPLHAARQFALLISFCLTKMNAGPVS